MIYVFVEAISSHYFNLFLRTVFNSEKTGKKNDITHDAVKKSTIQRGAESKMRQKSCRDCHWLHFNVKRMIDWGITRIVFVAQKWVRLNLEKKVAYA